MSDIEILKALSYDVTDIVSVFKSYFEKLEYTNFSGAYPYETETIIKNLKTSVLKTNIFKADLFSQPHPFNKTESEIFITDVFKFYSSIQESYYKLLYVYNQYVGFKIESSSSSSFSSSAGHDYNAALKIYENAISLWESFKEYIESMNIEYILAEKIENAMFNTSSDQRLNLLKFIKKIYDSRHGLTIIGLYGEVLRKVFEISTRENKPVIEYVNNLLEDLKIEILPPISRLTNNRKQTIQTLVQRHRLIPDAMSRPFSKLIYDLTSVKVNDDKPLASLPKVCKHISNKVRKYGFIVISKRIAQPIENNIWMLTDANYLQKNNLITSVETGVSDATIKRSRTIVKMEKPTAPQLDDGIYYINDEFSTENNFYYVLETLDGVNYRIMHPWYISIFSKKIYEIPSDRIPDLLSKKNQPSTRVESYNTILNDEILSHLHSPYIQQNDMSRLEKKQVEIKWTVIRKKIARGMLEDYRTLFDSNKVSKDNVLTLITNPTIFANSIKYIIHSLSLKQMSDHHLIEVYISSLQSLDNMKIGMSRDVATIYKENYQEKVLKLLEGGSSIANTIKIIDILEDVLILMLETHISEKSNIYSIIDQKIELIESIEFSDK